MAKTLEYKGHPLQRKDNIIYYGSFADKYMTDPSIKTRDKIVKKTEKDSLYTAIDVAAVWLERALASR